MSDLGRFVEAQASSYDHALAELRAGRKTGHWMWWIFPQLAGLGRSATSVGYAIASLDEARDYLADPVLGVRLRECAQAVLANPEQSAEQILGGIDALKLRSSMTLFARVANSPAVFRQVLDVFYDGEPDPATLALL